MMTATERYNRAAFLLGTRNIEVLESFDGAEFRGPGGHFRLEGKDGDVLVDLENREVVERSGADLLDLVLAAIGDDGAAMNAGSEPPTDPDAKKLWAARLLMPDGAELVSAGPEAVFYTCPSDRPGPASIWIRRYELADDGTFAKTYEPRLHSRRLNPNEVPAGWIPKSRRGLYAAQSDRRSDPALAIHETGHGKPASEDAEHPPEWPRQTTDSPICGCDHCERAREVTFVCWSGRHRISRDEWFNDWTCKSCAEKAQASRRSPPRPPAPPVDPDFFRQFTVTAPPRGEFS